MYELLGQESINRGLRKLHPDWNLTPSGLERMIDFESFLTAVRFIDLLAPQCEALNHHPDLTLKWRRIGLTLITHSAKRITSADFELASKVDLIAGELPKAN